MRKHIKLQILELLGTIKEGIAFTANSSKANAKNIFADCSEAFFSIKQILSNFLTDDKIQLYNNCIDKILKDIKACDEYIDQEQGNTLETLNFDIRNFEKKLKNEPLSFEIVFLPYKASMFDSFYTVWKAAAADDQCNAYVIPIPYYDKAPDRSFTQMHYEGELYPSDVPVTFYEDYDFEYRHPDVIFIHYPYDDCNFVTSVHPFFYSKNLKKYTNELVYIPYFVLDDINCNNKAFLKDLEGLVLGPGVLNSDKVIVQSENMRQAYINVFLDKLKPAANDKNIRSFFENKIIALGSPKFDCVAESMQDCDIPHQWLEIVQKPDSTYKKVIFYNTGIAAMLEQSEKMLDKIETVLKTFKSYTSEVALLWRPHPLLQATLKAMRPALVDRYESIVEKYKSEGWGIYDNTPNLDRSIAIADGYYGDYSSVVQLFGKANKPSIIQNALFTSNDIFKRLRSIYFCDDGESLWFVALHTDALFRYDKSSGKTELMCPLNSQTCYETYRWLCRVGKKIYMLPVFERCVAIYDIAKGELKKIELKSDFCKCDIKTAVYFTQGMLIDKFLYMFPSDFGAVVVMDIETEAIEYYNDFASDILFKKKNKVSEFRNFCFKDNFVYMTSRIANTIVKFDLNSKKFWVFDVERKKVGFNSLVFKDDLLYLGDQSEVILWSENKGIIKKIEFENSSVYAYLLDYDGTVVRIPCEGKTMYQTIRNDGTVSDTAFNIHTNYKCVGEIYPNNNAVLYAQTEKNKFYIYSTQEDALCVFDKNGILVYKYEFVIDCKYMDEFIKIKTYQLSNNIIKSVNAASFIFEDGITTNLEIFLNSDLKMSFLQKRNFENSGRKIYNKLKGDFNNV